jgi:hypothetical protein
MTDYTSPNFYTPQQCLQKYGQPRVIKGITIHWWGDPKAGYIFDGVCQTLVSPTRYASAHKVIEAGRVERLVDDVNAAWHAGSGTGNATTLGYECNPRASEEDYAEIANQIHEDRIKYGNLPLYGHSHWMATQCPGVYDLGKLNTLAGGLVVPPIPPFFKLTEDGIWGAMTTKRLQQKFGTPQDGVISHQWRQSANSNILACQFDTSGIGSTLVRAMQGKMGIKQDGLIGPDFVNHLEGRYGIPADGVISPVSITVQRMQRALNADQF